ncbi:hypothetical protein NPS53_08495 [Pseudomonas putida]|uniref:hypothetical protein n=1 Tax=Pseudomonas putida TaxID=303 RepID=UPI0023646245|nr:hypothetical protein [Pseudomonas putida]MDD2139611.1 hypothetical protein [Pseudomonas putida]HDS1721534.1 hypothetical protein [Pseudomonas putida]
MLIDFETLHRTYLIGWPQDGSWRFTPANEREPRKGLYASSHQVFSNNALQMALSIYNAIDEEGHCVGVNHCLYLLFSRKEGGTYKLSRDPGLISFHLDLGIAGELYGLVAGHCDSIDYRVVRAGKPPKNLAGGAVYRDSRRHVVLRASTSKDGQQRSIEVELDRAALIALGAHCIGYGKLLYPSLSDATVQGLLSSPTSNFRACAEIHTPVPESQPAQSSVVNNGDHEAMPVTVHRTPAPRPHVGTELGRLQKAIWAIGNQKWPSMKLPVLQAIQKLDDPEALQRLIDSGNAGDFREWDTYLG